MKFKLMIAALLLCGAAQANITDVHYNCDGGPMVTVGFNTITVDGKQHKYVASATGTGEHENGDQYDITGSEYSDGWIFVRGDSALSGLLVHEENFFYCEAI
jgi:hypothetical protein